MADEKVVLEITLDDGSIKKVFGNIRRDGEDAAKGIEQSIGSKLTSSFFSVRTAIVGAIAAIGGAAAFKEIVNAGLESEKAWRDFNVALGSTGQFTKQTSEAFQAYASSLEMVVGVQDEVIASGAALLLNVGRLSSTELPRVTTAALDLAAALQIGPEQAFQLVAKAASGSVEALGRYGIKIDENIPKGERFAAVLGIIESRFAGQGAAASQTFEGALSRASIAFSNITEALGLLVTKSPAAVAVLNVIANTVNGFSVSLEKLGKGGDVFGELIKKSLEFGQSVITWVVRPLEIAGNIGIVFVNGFMTGLNAVLSGLGRVAQGVLMVLDSLGMEVSSRVNNAVNNFTENSQQRMDEFAFSTAEAFTVVNQTPLSDQLDGFNMKLMEATVNSQTASVSIANSMRQASVASATAASDMQKNVASINAAFRNQLANGISSAIQSFTKSLVLGQGGFENFAKSMLGIAGDMAIQLGTMFIASGISIELLQKTPATAGLSIAVAGAALVAVGTVLKAVSGGGGGGASAGAVPSFPGGSDFSPGSGGSASQNNTPDLVAQTPQTTVSVNIQGNVLDRRQTGLEIAQIIQESFDANGTLVTGGVA